MTAEYLRETARLVRERADGATDNLWMVDEDFPTIVVAREGTPRWDVNTVASCGDELDAEHIASWSPDVALAVADFLFEAAGAWPGEIDTEARIVCCFPTRPCDMHGSAMDVARAYRGED